MTPDADLSDPIRTADETAPTGGAPQTEGLPDFLTVVEAARLLRIGRTSAYLLAQQWLYSDGRKGLPVVRVGRQLRVPRRALERLAGGELTPVMAPPSELRGVPVPSTATPTGAPTDDTPPDAEAHTRDHAPSAKPRARSRHAHGTQLPLFPTDR
jgi:excisionase family DNA binding protein